MMCREACGNASPPCEAEGIDDDISSRHEACPLQFPKHEPTAESKRILRLYGLSKTFGWPMVERLMLSENDLNPEEGCWILDACEMIESAVGRRAMRKQNAPG